MSKLTKTGVFIAVATCTYMTGTLAVTLWMDDQPYSSVTTATEPLKLYKPKLPKTVDLAIEAGRLLAELEDKLNRDRINGLRDNLELMRKYNNVLAIIERAERNR